MMQYEKQFVDYIQTEMRQDIAHDLNHVLRVVSTAKNLTEQEGACLEVVLPSAYLHDCFSFPKNHPERAQSSGVAAEKAIGFLSSIGYPAVYFEAVRHAIVAHSFSANVPPHSLEAKIVQDADRLDALGAIGIARCLQVNTSLGVGLYQSEDPFCTQRQPDDGSYAIDHFYNKLFKLAGTMHTASAKAEAEKRIAFMQAYLRQLGTEL
ncbi:phosphohydrolase [Arsukibacterium ikkense]|uniref:Phosphohydrolase n=1 Tax=Arsukibacterium ikkense TaxID=336831 RepID=A0A0M2V9H7_9GAMM|nr:HD domain-containing protein [Arsukibacterium ikkense]KKO47251.1 phosphohydrolase [Arsukibacterium ikkense]